MRCSDRSIDDIDTPRQLMHLEGFVQPITSRPRGAAWSARHLVTVEIVGSNPIEDACPGRGMRSNNFDALHIPGEVMQKTELRGDFIFVIDDFLTADECQHWIETAENIGFTDAPITTSSGPQMRQEIRNNTRIMYDSDALAQDLFERAKAFLVPSWFCRVPIGFNERFRFYKYVPGQRFAPHFDGRFDRGNRERSEFTFLVYLNDSYAGGTTRFFEPEQIDIVPRTGRALVFHHPQLHEGAIVEQGTKYVLRTDVMYGGNA